MTSAPTRRHRQPPRRQPRRQRVRLPLDDADPAPTTSPAFAQGYDLVAADGGIFNFGTAQFDGSMGGSYLSTPVVGMTKDVRTGGYWEVASDGGIFSFDAPFEGSMGGTSLNAPIVGMVSDNLTGGYWLVASDGGVFAFNTPFFGSMAVPNWTNQSLEWRPCPSGTATGSLRRTAAFSLSVMSPFYGSMGGISLNEPIVGMASNAFGNGYWLVAKDGGVFAFGSAQFYGSMGVPSSTSPSSEWLALRSGWATGSSLGTVDCLASAMLSSRDQWVEATSTRP